jgi:hypothetical protein
MSASEFPDRVGNQFPKTDADDPHCRPIVFDNALILLNDKNTEQWLACQDAPLARNWR